MSEARSFNAEGSDDVEETRAMPATHVSGPRQAGAQIGEFRLLRSLGKGGMAEVWLAEQTTLKRNVALKLLRADLMEDSNYVARFQTEAKAAAGLNHPNIVQVYTVGEANGQHFIAQEYVQGFTLKQLLQRRGPMDLTAALKVMRQVGAALAAAGERGIVHRDIKPENIMLTRKGEAKVADFGLAQLQGPEQLNLTQEGVTMGTPLYMSPEQVSGRKLDSRSDIYSFGITCYHMLTGRPPFEGENAVAVAVKHLHESPPSLTEARPDLPAAVCQLVDRMIAKDPEDRYQDAQSIVADVRKLLKAVSTGESLVDLIPGLDEKSRKPKLLRIETLAPAACIVAFVFSAALGWSSRETVPDSSRLPASRPKLGSAEEQFVSAMFQINDEAAFRAVLEHWKNQEDGIWRQRAHEQLAHLYLKDSRRRDDARAELELMQDGGDVARAKKMVGEAYLLAVDGVNNPPNLRLARNQITALTAQGLEQHLTGSWRQLEESVREILSEHERSAAIASPTESSR